MPAAPTLQVAIDAVPAGAWAVGVSGGADSVALLALLRDRPDLSPHVVHLNHQSRGPESDADEAFVVALAGEMGLPVTVDALDCVVPTLGAVPMNRAAKYRAARLALFRRVVASHGLRGTLLAHHRLDQAETVLLRLARGAGPLAVGGMAASRPDGAGGVVLRPLLDVPPAALRAELARRGRRWREDASNASPGCRRNRLRTVLREDAALVDALVDLSAAARDLRAWVNAVVPRTNEALPARAFDGLPPLARAAAARAWLAARGVPADDASPAVVGHLLAMMDDAATPARADFPGRVRVARRAGVLHATTPSP